MHVRIDFEKTPLSFDNPSRIIACYRADRLVHAFEEMESVLSAGYYLAGFLSYEAGYAFEEKLLRTGPCEYRFPLLYMGCFHSPQKLPRAFAPEPAQLHDIKPSLSIGDYASDIRRIRGYIEAGDVYQITYCLKMRFGFEGSASGLYQRLLRLQPVPYPAYIEAGEFAILSLSPEMFIKKRGPRVITKPMKGTWPRGRGILSDSVAGWRLKFDPKNRAENVMIADLLRNDLNRVGSGIKAPTLFEVRRYTTLYQMTSTVTASVAEDIPLYDLFKAVFPSGSVTGAPKMRAMEIIRELEGEERRIYTGAIGYITPQRDAFFNVPIRTLLLRGGRGEMGVGGGIVWDSTAEGEWQEGMLKSQFLFE